MAGSSPPARGTVDLRPPGTQRPRFIPACAGNGRPPNAGGKQRAVHPRLCGERASRARHRLGRRGSSPPARGTVGPEHADRDAGRFIPARAGNGRSCRRRGCTDPVHTRLRGERVNARPTKLCVAGSSPPAWGTGETHKSWRAQLRFIPACVGNGSRRSARSRRPTVHPRLRGERGVRRMGGRHAAGSSPPARGTVGADADLDALDRFIPACAGNGRLQTGRAPRRPVHPRLRGERDRGCADERQLIRFIPACAGNGSSSRPRRSRAAVHPRLRGERSSSSTMATGTFGSSPPARGTGESTRERGGRRRFIPACAGNGWPSRPRWAPTTVHPRLRGERLVRTSVSGWKHGSSPPARGTEGVPGWDGLLLRFIPACAGNGAWAGPTRCG